MTLLHFFFRAFYFHFFVKSFNFCIIGVLIMDCTSIRIILTSWQLNMKSPHRNSTFKKLFNLPPNEFLIGDFVMLSMRKLALQVYSDGWIWLRTAHLHKLFTYYSFQFHFWRVDSSYIQELLSFMPTYWYTKQGFHCNCFFILLFVLLVYDTKLDELGQCYELSF